MIGAFVMIFVAMWIYQSAIKANTGNVFMWVGITGAVFLASQVLLIDVNVYLLEMFRGGEGDSSYERDLTSVGDRKNEGGFQSGGGIFLSLFLELMPPIVGFLIVAVVRAQFMLKSGLSVATLFSGITEMFANGVKSIVDTIKQGIKK
jgi:hypothetical protein